MECILEHVLDTSVYRRMVPWQQQLDWRHTLPHDYIQLDPTCTHEAHGEADLCRQSSFARHWVGFVWQLPTLRSRSAFLGGQAECAEEPNTTSFAEVGVGRVSTILMCRWSIWTFPRLAGQKLLNAESSQQHQHKCQDPKVT